MINLDGFVKGEIAYVVDKDNVVELLTILETHSNINWISGSKPTNYNPFKSCCIQDDDDVTIIGMFKNDMGCIGIGHGGMMWFKSHNYKVEAF